MTLIREIYLKKLSSNFFRLPLKSMKPIPQSTENNTKISNNRDAISKNFEISINTCLVFMDCGTDFDGNIYLSRELRLP